MKQQKVLITGVYGLVGGAVYRRLAADPERYEVHGLGRRRVSSKRVSENDLVEVPEDRFALSDLSDLEQLKKIFAGFDCIVHMAANPNPDADWESLMRDNINASRNVYEAALQAGVRRVIYASTIQVSAGYHLHREPYRSISRLQFEKVEEPIRKVTADDPVWPFNDYGASKVFGEALGKVYAYERGLSVICIRIGWVAAGDRLGGKGGRDVFCSRRDIAQLVDKCVAADDSLKYEIFYGHSNNRYLWTDIDRARELVGYEPEDGRGYGDD